MGYKIYSEKQRIKELKQSLENVQHQVVVTEKKQGTNLAVKAHFLNTDHFYIDKHIESIPLLQKEIKSLKKVLNQQHLIENEAAKKRLEYLLNNNHISFSEGVVQSYPYFHETTETLSKPVEVNIHDINVILSRIEGIEINDNKPISSRPQLIITDFKLDKKKTGDNNEVFLLNMKLLKREFF
jgi:hypothetical protein